MEEILASIRRIIADDQVPKPADAAPERASSGPEPDDDVLDLAAVAKPVRRPEPVPEPDVFDMTEIDFGDEAEIDFEAPKPEPAAPPKARAPEPMPEFEEAMDAPLISKGTDASVNQSFGLLASAMAGQSARSMEEVVREMLRPLLKAWLDDNLPSLVERLVRAEIERVARGH